MKKNTEIGVLIRLLINSTIVIYTKATSKIINGKEVSSTSNTRYYISSMQYGEESTLHQIARSIDEYWAIETYHHGHLDCGSLAQDDLQLSMTYEYDQL